MKLENVKIVDYKHEIVECEDLDSVVETQVMKYCMRQPPSFFYENNREIRVI